MTQLNNSMECINCKHGTSVCFCRCHGYGTQAVGCDKEKLEVENQILNKQIKLLREIEKSYKTLEKTGHITKGAVSDNVNWKEIELLLHSSYEAGREESKGNMFFREEVNAMLDGKEKEVREEVLKMVEEMKEKESNHNEDGYRTDCPVDEHCNECEDSVAISYKNHALSALAEKLKVK